MIGRALPLALASAVTTLLVAGAVAIETASAAGLGGPGVGIIGVLVGLVAALVAAVVVGLAVTSGRLSRNATVALVAYGTLGVVFLAVAALKYVNVPGADETFTMPVQVVVSVACAVAAAALVARSGRPDAAAT
ncbi:permease [Halobaculum marinum]|uniref:Permease n=1 Tax=Halobaculum marinum TaxID=3031996 RepID=A0ABD5WT86_9EURY|nr:permease [Halobaculum sp. DT55]